MPLGTNIKKQTIIYLKKGHETREKQGLNFLKFDGMRSSHNLDLIDLLR